MNDFQNNRPASTQSRIGGDAQALASRKVRPIFDAESIRQPGFAMFSEAWRNVEPPAWCHIPRFEYEKLAEVERTYVDALISARRMSILDNGNDSNYGPMFDKLVAMKVQEIAMVLGNSADVNTILATGKRDFLKVQPCQLTDKGTLAVRFISNLYQTAPRPVTPRPLPKPEEATKQYDGFVIATRPESIVISVLRPRFPLSIGGTVYNSQGMSVLLKSEAMVNDDSITYTTNHPGLWAKIYVPKSLTTLTEEKCKRMLSKQVQFKGLCWHTDNIRDKDVEFVLTIVSEAKGIPLSQCIFKGVENGIHKYFPNWDKRQLTQLTVTILEKIKYMHSMGILFGCLNPASILVQDENNVYFTDADHYQIEGFPCLIRNTMFTPPELQDKLRRNKMYLCTMDNEKYSIALLLFRLMMPGKMPYTIEDNIHAPDFIIRQKFAFSFGREHGSERTVGSWRYVWSHLVPRLKESFYRTFQNGERLNTPERRPSAGLWLTLMRDFKDELERENLYDPHSRELIPKRFKRSQNDDFIRCSYCGMEHPRNYFDKDYLICKTCAEKPSKVSFICEDCGRTFIYTNRTALFHERMTRQDDSWCKQKHCRDCKSKTVKCLSCKKDVPLFRVKNGYCSDCRNAIYRKNVRCKDCGNYYDITIGEHENAALKGFPDPVRCKSCREAKKRSRY